MAATLRMAAFIAVIAAAFSQPLSRPGYAAGLNGEAPLPPMGWRSWNAMGACIRSGLPGDGSNCTLPGGREASDAAHRCRTCGSIASAVDGVTDRNWTMAGHAGKVRGEGEGAALRAAAAADLLFKSARLCCCCNCSRCGPVY